MDPGDELRTAHRTAAMLSAAFLTSVAMYGVALHVLAAFQAPFEGLVPELLEGGPWRYGAWGLAAAVGGALPAVRRRLLTKAPRESGREAIGRLARAATVTSALAEVPAVLGFLLGALGGFRLDFFALAALSVGLMLAYRPRLDAWREWVREPAPRP